MAELVKLNPQELQQLHEQNPCLMSYNVEFAEVTGGTFWKAYTPGQIAGTEAFYVEKRDSLTEMHKDLMQVYPPIDLYDPKLRKLTKELGTAWVRVSGTWSTKTYYDFDGEYTDGSIPAGYLNVLTKQQWIGVLDFVRDCGLKLKISMANCPGVHSADEPWPTTEAEKIFKFSKEYGVPISAAEFANEPNMLEETGFPKGYTAENYSRDCDIFAAWMKENYPECLYVGPSSTGGDNVVFGKKKVGGVESLVESVGCDDLMGATKVPLDVFSYHYYNGLSERLGAVNPDAHWDPSEALTEEYLDTAASFCRTYIPFRDKYCPGGEMWVTESGDAGGGGNTWASTYLDVPRTLNELASFSSMTRGVIFHNTLAASDYGYLQRQVFNPRPNYFAVKLWNDLMGTTVYATNEPIREGAHVYCQSYKADPSKKCYLVINNSETETTTVDVPNDGMIWVLNCKDGFKRSTVMTLNGHDLVMSEDWEMPDLSGVAIAAGKIELAPLACAFIVV